MICTALAFIVFFALIREVGAARALVFTYVNPAVALAAGVIVLGEPLTAWNIAGLALILTGSVLATRRSDYLTVDVGLDELFRTRRYGLFNSPSSRHRPFRRTSTHVHGSQQAPSPAEARNETVFVPVLHPGDLDGGSAQAADRVRGAANGHTRSSSRSRCWRTRRMCPRRTSRDSTSPLWQPGSDAGPPRSRRLTSSHASSRKLWRGRTHRDRGAHPTRTAASRLMIQTSGDEGARRAPRTPPSRPKEDAMPIYTCTTVESTLAAGKPLWPSRSRDSLAINHVPSTSPWSSSTNGSREHLHRRRAGGPLMISGWVRDGHPVNETNCRERDRWGRHRVSSSAPFAVEGGRVLPGPGEEARLARRRKPIGVAMHAIEVTQTGGPDVLTLRRAAVPMPGRARC